MDDSDEILKGEKGPILLGSITQEKLLRLPRSEVLGRFYACPSYPSVVSISKLQSESRLSDSISPMLSSESENVNLQ